MKQVLNNMKDGGLIIVETPVPKTSKSSIRIKSIRSLISTGTERMLVDFGKASYINKAKQQPEKVKQVLSKIRTDGFIDTFDAVKSKLTSPVITSCITAVQLSRWLNELGAQSVEHIGSYNCRKIRNSQKLSEHSFGKAIDISRLDNAVLEDHWNDSGAKGEKLRKAAKLACKYFTNVLTPDSNSLHKDHFHFDNKAGLYTRWHYWFGCK